MKLTFDTNNLVEISSSVDGLFLSPDSANKIRDFEKFYDEIEVFRKEVLAKIAETAEGFDPNFKSITGEGVKISYSAHGAKYSIDESFLPDIPEGLYKVETKVRAISEAIDEYVKEQKGLPIGIIAPERKKSISIRVEND